MQNLHGGFNTSFQGMPITGHTVGYRSDGSGRDTYVAFTRGGFSKYQISDPVDTGMVFNNRNFWNAL